MTETELYNQFYTFMTTLTIPKAIVWLILYVMTIPGGIRNRAKYKRWDRLREKFGKRWK